MQQPRVFVGSSSEAEAIDQQVRLALERLGVTPVPWSSVVPPGEYLLDALLDMSMEVDGALLLATSDDQQEYRGVSRMTPRDNILLEAGIFLAVFGRQRAGIVRVAPEGQIDPALPSDLAGLNVIVLDPSKPERYEPQLHAWVSRLRAITTAGGYSAQRLLAPHRRILQLPPTWQLEIERLVLDPFHERMVKACRGEILLRPQEYYAELFREMDSAGEGTEVWAVATLSSLIWSDDQQQGEYRSRNLRAAARGVKIRRLFALPDGHRGKLRPLIEEQIRAGIEIRQASRSVLSEHHTLEDIVIFKDRLTGRIRAYSAHPAFDNLKRIRCGTMHLDEQWCGGQLRRLERVWFGAREVPTASKFAPQQAETSGGQAPGLRMKTYFTETEVVSCEDAARSRGVPLTNELKTLILTTSKGLAAVHLPGNREVSLRAVKDEMECSEAHLANEEVLRSLNLSRGIVSAVLEPVWSLPHLVSRSVLALDYVTTNNGTLKGYLRFSPSLLLKAKRVRIGDFERAVLEVPERLLPQEVGPAITP